MPGKLTKEIELIKKDGLTKTSHQIRTLTNMLKLKVETKLLLEVDQEPNKATTTKHNQDLKLATKPEVLQAQATVVNNKPTTTITTHQLPLKCHTQRPN